MHARFKFFCASHFAEQHHTISEVDPKPRSSGPAFNGGMGRAIGIVEGMANHAERQGGVVFLYFASHAHSQMILGQLAFRSRTFFAVVVKK